MTALLLFTNFRICFYIVCFSGLAYCDFYSSFFEEMILLFFKMHASKIDFFEKTIRIYFSLIKITFKKYVTVSH
jgi:hypothetical protein